MTPKYDSQSLHEFDQLTALNGIGAAMGESSITPTTQPTFTRQTVQLKILKKKGTTTDFLRAATQKKIDAAAANMEATLISMVHDICNYNMYGNGNATSNTYEYSGFDTFIDTNRIVNGAGGVALTSLSQLDDLIDRNLELQGSEHKKAFFMSAGMLSRASQIESTVRKNMDVGQGGKMSVMDIPGGWRLNAYRDIPIIVSGQCKPKATCATPTYAAGTCAGGGMTDAMTRYVRVSAITKDGETIACPEVTCTGGSNGGTTNTMVLTIAANISAYRYKIYVGTASGTHYLRHVIPGFAYSAAGTVAASTTNTITGIKSWASDANGNTITMTFITDPNTAGAEITSTTALTDIPLDYSNGVAPENIWLIDLDEFQGMGRMPYSTMGGSSYNGLVSFEFLAKTDADLPFLYQCYTAVCPSFEATSCLLRGVRVQ